jgi:uridine kinase
LTVKVFVDADWDVRLLRRLKRDVRERGRTIESVLTQYKESVSPMHDAFVSKGQRWSDCLLNTHDFSVDQVLERLAGLI